MRCARLFNTCLWLRFLLFAALTGCLVVAGCGRGDAPAPPPPPAPQVGTVTLKTQSVVLSEVLPGRTVPYQVAQIRPQVNGILQKRLFTEGAEVKAGDVLYVIDPSPYEAAYNAAKGALAEAEARRSSARATLSNAQAAQTSAKAAVTAAKARKTAALANLDAAKAALASAATSQTQAEVNAIPLRLRANRYRDLVSGGAISQQDLDDATSAEQQANASIETAKAAVQGTQAGIAQAEAAIEVAEAEILSAEAALKSTDAGIESAKAGIESAEAAITSAKAMVEQNAINLEYTKITAPISGRIGRSLVTIGALVTAHQPASLATIQQLDPIYVDVSQATADLLRLQRQLADGSLTHDDKQNAVTLILEDGTPYAKQGKLEFRDVSVDPTTGSFILRMLFPNPDKLLLPGMYVRAEVQEGVQSDAVLIPQQAVLRNSKGDPQTLIVTADSKAELRDLVLNRAIKDQWLVEKGVSAGEQVITEGSQRVRPGAAVNASPAEDAPPAGQPAPATKAD